MAEREIPTILAGILVGSAVQIKSLKKNGTVTEVLSRERYRVSVGSLSIIIQHSDLILRKEVKIDKPLKISARSAKGRTDPRNLVPSRPRSLADRRPVARDGMQCSAALGMRPCNRRCRHQLGFAAGLCAVDLQLLAPRIRRFRAGVVDADEKRISAHSILNLEMLS